MNEIYFGEQCYFFFKLVLLCINKLTQLTYTVLNNYLYKFVYIDVLSDYFYIHVVNTL